MTPESLLKQAEELLEELDKEGLGSGYKSISEFVKDAVGVVLPQMVLVVDS